MFEKEAESKAIETCPSNLDMPTYVQGFVNGAEFGYNKTNEWHDLEKNPNDLPKDYVDVWCDYGESYGKGFYHKDDGGWWIEGHMFCSSIDAWCELPKRDKGE